jgi:hypothetical protein
MRRRGRQTKVDRPGARLVAVVASVAIVFAAVTSGTSVASGAKARRDPALVTISGSSASLVEDGDAHRLVISGVSPDATFDARRTPPAEIGTYGAVVLLNTATAPALLRGTTDAENEGLLLTSITYDETTGTLEADAAGVDGVTDLPAMKGAGDTSDSDGLLPTGPVELVVGDTDTRVAASGKPQRPRGFSVSYSVPVKIQYNTISYNGQHAAATISGEFLGDKSKCAAGKNFSERASTRSPIETSFDVSTELGCFFDVSIAVYKITVSGTAGPGRLPGSESELTLTSVGPRSFVSACPDTGGAFIDCNTTVGPRVAVNIKSK